MDVRKKATEAAPSTDANIHNPNDLTKVLDYFQHETGTTLDCMFATGVLRNCVTWYVRHLERIGLIRAIYIDRDRRTHYLAKHYSADKTKWLINQEDIQLTLFNDLA